MSTRKQIANAFKAAKRLLESEQERFICIALNRVLHGKAARSIVERRLDGFATTSDWLINRAGISRHAVYVGNRRLVYRLRWLDALIKEFSA